MPLWILLIFYIMSLTVARSERVRGVLTHASRAEILKLNFSGVRVSNTLYVIVGVVLIANKKQAITVINKY